VPLPLNNLAEEAAMQIQGWLAHLCRQEQLVDPALIHINYL